MPEQKKGNFMKQNCKKHYTIYLSESDIERLKERAERDGMKISELIRHLTLTNLSDTPNYNTVNIYEEQGKTHEIKLRLVESDYIKLKTACAETGLDMSNYLRQCIRLKKMKLFNISIKHNDLDEHTLLVAELTKKIISICKTISSSKNAYPQEIAKIQQLMQAINDDNKQILHVIFKDRKRLYLEAKKELLKNIRES